MRNGKYSKVTSVNGIPVIRRVGKTPAGNSYTASRNGKGAKFVEVISPRPSGKKGTVRTAKFTGDTLRAKVREEFGPKHGLVSSSSLPYKRKTK